ncbi:MAG: dihydrolipoyl dehydrogenase [Sulfurimonas sp.]
MKREVDVAVIGAGSAGLYALSQVKKQTGDFVLINSGYLGTTCARVGCMPSKALIYIAEYYHQRKKFSEKGLEADETIQPPLRKVLQEIRDKRDRLVAETIKTSISKLGDKLIEGEAQFVNHHTLLVNDEAITAKKIIIATGSTPIVNPEWEAFRENLLTSDELFEQHDLPPSIGVVGLGAVGLEIGQALARLGIRITAVHSNKFLGGLSDPEVNHAMVKHCSGEFDIWLDGGHATLEKAGDKIKIINGEREVIVDKVLVATGRKPNLKSLKLEKVGIMLDNHGMPRFNDDTMQIEDLPIFIAGDVNNDRPLMHEAADEGRIAGYNTVHNITKFKRKVPLTIVFSDPNIAYIGKRYKEIEEREDILIGSFDFTKQQRAMLMDSNYGLARLYMEKESGRIVGAEMAAPGAEHLAHHLAWAMEQEMTVYEMIQLPFYHPTVEEGLYMLLLDCVKKLGRKMEGLLEIPFA